VSTSTGEECLDIDEIDLIIFYDVQSSPSRFVKRSEQTGLQGQGRVVYLVSEGREESFFQQMCLNNHALKQALSRTNQQFLLIRGDQSISIDGSWSTVRVRTMLQKAPLKKAKSEYLLCTSEYKPVPALNLLKSDNWQLSKTRNVSHSARTLAFSSLFQLPSDSELVQSCRAIWKSAIASNPVFQPFDYQPNDLQDYQQFFNTLLRSRALQPPSSDSELSLPEEFFSIDELNGSEGNHNDLEQYDWSDPEFS
jgi:hypothetical protein